LSIIWSITAAPSWRRETVRTPVAFINGPDQQLDVLFTDIRLGGALDGWDVAEIFRDRFPEVRVVYASGHFDQRRDVAESQFFAKPYRLDDILEACKR
jgi:hypothetical protein